MIAFYNLTEPHHDNPDQFADPWYAEESFEPVEWRCPKCGKWKEPPRRRDDLIIEWGEIDKHSPGSDVIADFNIIGGPQSIMISDRMHNFLRLSQFRSFKFGPVSMVQDPKLKKPKRLTARTKKRVWLPYLGPPVYELIVTGKCGIDFGVNQVEVSEHLVCSHCQRYQKLFLRPSNMVPWIVRQSDWDGSDIFHLDFPDPDFNSDACFVTEKLREALMAENFTNLGFKPHGYIE